MYQFLIIAYLFTFVRKRHSCETQLITVMNDWAKILDKGGHVNTFILDFEKAFDTPLMNYLNASCMVMLLVKRLKWIDSFLLLYINDITTDTAVC